MQTDDIKIDLPTGLFIVSQQAGMSALSMQMIKIVSQV